MGFRMTLAAVAAALLLCAAPARAGFLWSYDVEAGTGTLADKLIFRFYGKNDQTGEQADSRSLYGYDLTWTASGGKFAIDFRDVDGDGLDDANVFGKDLDFAAPTATFTRLGDYASQWYPFTMPKSNTTKAGIRPANPTAVADFTDISVLRAITFNRGALDATQGRGLLYAVAVVDNTVSQITVVGQAGAEKGGATGTPAAPFGYIPDDGGPLGAEPVYEPGEQIPVSFVALAPEPGALLPLALVGLALLRRRRV